MFFGNKEKQRKSRELDSILDELRRNLENNYKDAAQQDLKRAEAGGVPVAIKKIYP